MIQEGKMVSGVDFKGNNIKGIVEGVAGFGDVAIVRVNEDRTGLVQCYVNDLEIQK